MDIGIGNEVGAQENWIIAAALTALVATLGWWAGRRPPAAMRDAARAAPSFSGDVVRIGADGALYAARSVKSLLGLSRRVGLSPKDFRHLRLETGGFLSDTIENLALRGRPFEVIVETPSGGFAQATGRVNGTRAAVEFRDVTEHLRRARAAERQLAAAQTEAEQLREAMRLINVAAWSKAPGGAEAWHELSQSDLEASAQQALVRSAHRRGPKRKSIDENSGVRHFQVNAASDAFELVVARPIDEVVEVERLMNRLVTTMSETFAHLSVGLMIFDDRKRLSLFNPAIIDIFDEAAEWLATRPGIDEILDRWRSQGKLPERLDFADWKKAFSAINIADGEPPLEEKWHLLDGRTLRTLKRGHPSGGLALVVEDITESVTLARTSVSERALRSVTTDFLNEAIVVLGRDGGIRMTNRAFHSTWGLDEPGSSGIDNVSALVDLCSARCEPSDFWPRLRLVATGDGDRAKLDRQLRLSGDKIVSPRVSTMPDGSTLVVFTDITASETVAEALKQRNEALEHADEMRSGLMDQISHRMRTPLNSIYGFAQILAGERFGELNDSQREYADAIVGSAAELVEVVGEMSDLISIEGEPASDEEELNLTELFDEAIALAHVRFGDRSLSVAKTIKAEPQSIPGRRSRLRQSIFNMLVDAFSQTNAGGEVAIQIDADADGFSLSVNHELQAGSQDSGLALSLARRSIALCGGEISVQKIDDSRRQIDAVVSANALRGQFSGGPDFLT